MVEARSGTTIVIPAKAGIPAGEKRRFPSPAGAPAFAGATERPDGSPRDPGFRRDDGLLGPS